MKIPSVQLSMSETVKNRTKTLIALIKLYKLIYNLKKHISLYTIIYKLTYNVYQKLNFDIQNNKNWIENNDY
jgi:hypothetical protein